MQISSKHIAEPNFQSIFAALPGLYLIMDPQLVIRAANDEYLAATMTTREQIFGRNVFDVFPENPHDPTATDRDTLSKSLNTVLNTKTIHVMPAIRYDIKAQDGTYEQRYWRPVNSPVLNQSGDIEYIINRVEDVTALIKMREAQQRAHEVESINRAKDEFLAMLSHELRSPVNVIYGWSELLSQNLLEQSEYPKVFTTLYTNARQQLKLIDDLLDVSRAISGKLALDTKPCRIVDLVEKSVLGAKVIAGTKALSIDVCTNGKDVMVEADEVRMLQVFGNLLTNAIKFSNEGGRIEVSLQTKDHNVEIYFRDEGEGIEAEFIPLVFERFSQSKSGSSRNNSGLGLGLAICQNLIQLHKGSIKVESPGKGKGATFIICMPHL